MERELNSEAHLPRGFRFHPSDEELIVHYLQNRVASLPLPASIIAEVDLYKYDPWELPKRALFGEDEWYFFSPRDRKYPNGARPNRVAGSGYWKATGTDKPILSSFASKQIGVKKALAFYRGRPRKGTKTDWTMNEYRLLETVTKPPKSKGAMRLDDWVLCQVRRKGNTGKSLSEIQKSQRTEPIRRLPRIEEVCPTFEDKKNDIITDCLKQDCRLLAFILAGQVLSNTETISGNSTSVQEHGSDEVSLPMVVSSLDGYFNTLKRESNAKNREENLLPCNEKLTGDSRIEDLFPKKALPNNALNYYSLTQSEGGIYNFNSSKSSTKSKELNELAFHY